MLEGGFWTDVQYKQHFHMCKAHFEELVAILSPHVQGGSSNYKASISVEQKLAVALMKLTNEGSSYRTCGRLVFGVGRSTACKTFHQIVYAINDHMKDMLAWPTLDQAKLIKAAFSQKGFPNCMGAIDGTHFKVSKPNVPYYEDYYCLRKSSCTVQMQAVCDHRGSFMDVVIGRPGSMHDARVLRLSGLYQNAHTKILTLGPPVALATETLVTPYLLGDAGYANLPWLIAPLPTPRNGLLSRRNQAWNTHHSSARMIIEQAFGRLKGRFRTLLGVARHGIAFVSEVARACVILHNFLISRGDDGQAYYEEPQVEDVAAEVGNAGLVHDVNVGRTKREALIDHYRHLRGWPSLQEDHDD